MIAVTWPFSKSEQLVLKCKEETHSTKLFKGVYCMQHASRCRGKVTAVQPIELVMILEGDMPRCQNGDEFTMFASNAAPNASKLSGVWLTLCSNMLQL